MIELDENENSWRVIVPTRGDTASLQRVKRNIVDNLPGVPITIVRNGTGATSAGQDRLDTREWDGVWHPQVRVVAQPGGGVSRARNAALVSGGVRTLVFTDDDVIITRAALEQLVSRQRALHAAVSTARVVPARSSVPVAPLFDLYLGFDRGTASRTWSLVTDQESLSPMRVWELGVGATFAVDLRQLAASSVRFDERLSNGRFCGGTEDVDFFFRVYLAGLAVSYVAEAIVVHIFPTSTKAAKAKCRQYALSDGAFYAKWFSRVSLKDVLREIRGWAGRVVQHICNRAAGRPAIPITTLLAEPLYKVTGGVSWLLALRRSS